MGKSGESTLHIEKSKCEGPEAGTSLTCLSNRNNIRWLNREGGGREVETKEDRTGFVGHSKECGFYSTCDEKLESNHT